MPFTLFALIDAVSCELESLIKCSVSFSIFINNITAYFYEILWYNFETILLTSKGFHFKIIAFKSWFGGHLGWEEYGGTAKVN